MTIDVWSTRLAQIVVGLAYLTVGIPSALAQTVSGNTSHTLVVKPDGSAWAWGANSSGQIGDGTTTRRDVPKQVSTISGIVAVAAGGNFSLALKSDGTLWAWGANTVVLAEIFAVC